MSGTEELLQERGKTHGDFTDNARISQTLKTVMRGAKNWDGLIVYQKEALEMIAHKISRMLSGDPYCEDHARDIAGYATLLADRLREANAGSGS